MNRLKLLTMATLMALTFTACDEGTPPPVEPDPPPDPVGMISGTVTIDGSGAAGLTATLSSGATQTTNTSGAFTFADVVAGSYTVTISGHPDDVTFPAATQSATIASNGQTVQLNFPGQYIRSSSVVGNVVASDAMMSATDSDGQPDVLAGVTVTLTGDHAMAEPQQTDMSTGGYAFTGLRAGTYTVEISGFPEDVRFDEPSMTVEVGVGDVEKANFEGAYIRTATVEGRVIIEDEGLAGVTVTLVGGPGNDSYTKMTGDNGEYAFTELRPGDYQVSISGYDADDYEFASNSHDVSVELDETETVSFTGVLLRTSGISGRVSVAGTGLDSITVTLSGAADDTTMTDPSGQYAFAGLAAGDYTVSIAVESNAYVFDSMSKDKTVGDDDSQIVNFEGAHDTSASVSGMLFIDEASRDSVYSEGENAFPAPGVLMALVGPGVLDVKTAPTGPDGSFMFPNLRAGPYQLLVNITPEILAALGDFAYGGPATGYGFALGVAEEKTQNIPFYITHTMVNFSVMLRSGDDTGDALPGATVNLYSDAAGETKVGSGETGEEGEAAEIRIARAGTSGNMVHAGVSADGYHVAEGLTPVPWDPQIPQTVGANANDIVNLNVNATFSGATITRGERGGDALAGWAIEVMMDDEAVEGAPVVLSDAGLEGFESEVEFADLGATFTVSLAEDQDDKLDGGESYEAAPIEYTHTGLSLSGPMDIGTLEASYTTQTLKVYVHEERDQVEGFTGNILGGDKRHTGKVSDKLDVEVRHIAGGRSRAIEKSVWDATKNTADDEKGMLTFSHLPADLDIIVVADEARGENIMVLDPDEIPAYTDLEAVMGGAFGDMGGYSHTVSLCPLQATDPTDQDHDECGSFAYVNTHAVDGQAWENQVEMDDGEGFEMKTEVAVPGTKVQMDYVQGKNLGRDSDSFTAADEDNSKTKDIDETKQFDFGRMAAGRYTVAVSDGWSANSGKVFNLDADLNIDVTPKTGILYGYVTNEGGVGQADVTVTVNGIEDTSDQFGRYIVTGFGPATRTVKKVTHRNMVFVETDHAGHELQIVAFAANTPTQVDVGIEGTTDKASVSGTVSYVNGGGGVSGVEIRVDGAAPTNAATSGANAGKLVTGSDGSYTAEFEAGGVGENVSVSAQAKGLHFTPAAQTVPAHKGAATEGINFGAYRNATISGKVTDSEGQAMEGVKVTATKAGADAAEAEYTTSARGVFALSVSGGSFTIEASKEGYTFEYPQTGNVVAVNANQALTFNIEASLASTTALKSVRVNGTSVAANDDGEYEHNVGKDVETASVVVTPAHPDAEVEYSGQDDTDDAADGIQFELEVGDNKVTATVTVGDDSKAYTIVVTRADDAATAPQRLEAKSMESGKLSVSWRSPAGSGRLLVDGYQYKVDDGDWMDVADADVTAGGGSQELDDLVDGVDVEISVRAYSDSGVDDDAATEDVDESKVVGDAASITAASWPDVMAASFDPPSIDEVDDDETEDDAENESKLTITMSGRAFADFDVMLSVADDDHAGLVEFDKKVTIRRGQNSAEVEVTAVDDDESAAEGSSTAVTFEVTLAPEEAEDRDATEAVLTIKDDEDATDTTDPTTPTPPASALSAPRDLKITSPASEALTVNWIHPADIPANLEAFAYEIRADDDEDWTSVTGTGSPTGHSHAFTSGLQNGREETYWVRANGIDPDTEDDATTDDVDESMVVGDSAMVSGAAWPVVTAAFDEASITETDDEETAGVVENESTLTITAAGQVYQSFDVTVSVSVDGEDEEGNDGAVTFDETQVTIGVGNSSTATIEVTAVNDELAGAKTIVVDVKLVPAEAADRDPVNPGTPLTITDDDDVAPGEPADVAVSGPTAQTTTTSTRLVTWTAPTAWGSGAEATRGFEYRTYVTNIALAERPEWTTVPGGATALSVSVTLDRPAAGDAQISYTVEVRAETEAGPGTAGSDTQLENAPS